MKKRTHLATALFIVSLLSSSGCDLFNGSERFAENGVKAIASAYASIGHAALNDLRTYSHDWREVVSAMPREAEGVLRPLIDSSLNRFGRNVYGFLDYGEFKLQANAESLRNSLLDAMLEIHENGVTNQAALATILQNVEFSPTMPSPRIVDPPREIVLDYHKSGVNDEFLIEMGYHGLAIGSDANWSLTFAGDKQEPLHTPEEPSRFIVIRPNAHSFILRGSRSKLGIKPEHRSLLIQYGNDQPTAIPLVHLHRWPASWRVILVFRKIDNEIRVDLNDRPVYALKTHDVDQYREVDVTASIKPGANKLSFRGYNCWLAAFPSSPWGFELSLELRAGDQKIRELAMFRDDSGGQCVPGSTTAVVTESIWFDLDY